MCNLMNLPVKCCQMAVIPKFVRGFNKVRPHHKLVPSYIQFPVFNHSIQFSNYFEKTWALDGFPTDLTQCQESKLTALRSSTWLRIEKCHWSICEVRVESGRFNPRRTCLTFDHFPLPPKALCRPKRTHTNPIEPRHTLRRKGKQFIRRYLTALFTSHGMPSL